ncbi:MAG: hypothetical protein J5I93_00625 [Pirellulaceae bacterium]|nr:hypothetical protein [Pirellulaceae bacterium]
MKRQFPWHLACALIMSGCCTAVQADEPSAPRDPAGQPADERPWIDLLADLDPARQSVAGQWRKSGGELTVDAATGARLTLPWKKVAEYDLQVEFTRRGGEHSIALIFVAGGNQATLDIDGWGQHLAGIQNIAGRTMRDNPTRVDNIRLENNRRYLAEVRVRKDRVEALLDGKPLVAYRTDGSDLALLDLWRLPDTGSLGLGAWDSATTFHRVRMRPLAGLAPTANRSMPAQPAARPIPSPPADSTVNAADDLVSLSDEFDDAATIGNWQRVYQVERTGADQLERFDIGRTRAGWLTLVPRTSTWYNDYRGVLLFKEVAGDFVATTSVIASNRDGRGAPRSDYSLGGLMIRTPRAPAATGWQPGGENYIFLSLGAAQPPGRFAFEVKTTVRGNSRPEIEPLASDRAEIRIARLGEHFVLLRRLDGGEWTVHRRYHRPDMPRQLQVGLTVYTDYGTASRFAPQLHNTRVIPQGRPDLVASFDYLRLRRPAVPPHLRGRRHSDPASIEDAELLGFLGFEAVSPTRASRAGGSPDG